MFNPTWFYVGAIYAAAVWLARRAKIDLPLRVAVFFYALVFVFLYLPLTQDYVNIPVDFLKTLPPWAHMVREHSSSNGMMNDIVLQIVPWAHQVREAWRSLTPPLWNELSASGYPLLANPQSSALSPLRILALPLNLGHAMTGEGAMKILIALTFTFLFCRRRGYSELASAIGGVAFGFSTFIITWLHFPLVTAACLLPVVLYIVDLLAEEITYRRFVAAAAVWAAMLFAGHPETAAHTFFIALMYVLWIVLVERRANALKFLGVLALALVVAALLAAPLLGPFAEALTKSKRFQELEANPPGALVPFSDWPCFKVLLQPHFFGEMPYEPPWGPAHPESITGFAGYLGVAAWFAILANVIATRAWRSRELFFALAALLILGVIMSWPGVREVFHFVFRLAANARIRLLIALLLAIQTAALVDLIQRGKRLAVLIGILAASALLLYVFADTHFTNAYRHDTAVLAMLPSIAVLLIAAIATIVRRNHFALMLLLVAITAELWEIHRDWNPTIPNRWMYPRTPILEKMDELHAKAPATEPFRIVGAGPTFFPNLNGAYGYEDIRPHDPMANGRYIGLVRHIVPSYDADDYFARWNDFETRFLDYLNVRYVMTPWMGELPPHKFALVYDGRDGRIFENRTVLPRFYPVRNVIIDFNDDSFYRRLRENEEWNQTAILDKLELENRQQHDDFFNPRSPDAPIAASKILEASPTRYRIHVKAPRYSLIVSSIPWWPGWKVERNGARVDPIRVNGGFLGFAVPAGELDVRVWYDPWTFRLGVIISVATLIALIAFARRAT